MSGQQVPRTRGLLLSALTTGTRGRRLLTLLALAIVTLLAPTVVVVAWLTWLGLRRRPDRVRSWVWVVVGMTLTGLAAVMLTAYVVTWQQVVMRSVAALDHQMSWPEKRWLLLLVVWGCAIGPVVGALWWRWDQGWRERQPLAGRWERKRREEWEQARRAKMTHLVQAVAHTETRWPKPARQVAKVLAVPTSTRKGGAVLGRLLAGTLAWDKTLTGLVVVPARVRHLVVLGATRAGKSESVMRVVENDIENAMHTDKQVIYLNCKQPRPGQEPSLRLAAVAGRHGRSVQVLAKKTSPWDPMRGTPDQVRQRLLSTQVFGDEYYEHISAVILGLALDLAASTEKPIESLPDLVWSLVDGQIEKMAKTNPQAASLMSRLQDRDLNGAVMRWASQALALRDWIGPPQGGGWGWEDADVTVADLPTSTEPSAAKALLRAMLTDLEGWITDPVRRPNGPGGRPRPCRLVIEEVSALDTDPVLSRRIVNLVERAAGAGVDVVIVAQGPSGLGDDRAQEALLTNCAVVTCRQTDRDAVERLASLAGTDLVEEGSGSYGDVGALTAGAAGSIRYQHTFRVDPNVLRTLPLGHVIVIHEGQWGRVAVAMSEHGYQAPSGDQVVKIATMLEASRDTQAIKGIRQIEEYLGLQAPEDPYKEI